MAPGRPYWKGYLKLALVSCPIALYTGTSSTERVSFRQINKKTGNRLRQQLIDEVTREPVEGSDKGRGYEYDKGAYIQVEDDELDAIAIESNHTVDIDTFVPRDQIDERYLDSTYYIIPDDQVGQDLGDLGVPARRPLPDRPRPVNATTQANQVRRVIGPAVRHQRALHREADRMNPLVMLGRRLAEQFRDPHAEDLREPAHQRNCGRL